MKLSMFFFTMLLLLTMPFTLLSSMAVAAEKFNVDFLKEISGDADIDPSLYEVGGALNGTYKYDIFLSDTFVSTDEIVFEKSIPCIKETHLEQVGVLPEVLGLVYQSGKVQCLDMAVARQFGMGIDIDSGDNKINFNIPGKYLGENKLSAKDGRNIDAKSASNGISAFYLNYDVLESQTSANGGGKSMSGRFNYGLNGGDVIDGWSVHSSASLSKNNDEKIFSKGDTYFARDIVWLKSTVNLGDVSMENDFFGGNSIRGVKLNNIEALNDKPSGASPVITGIANSNAKVEVFQEERLVGMQMVPPGPYQLEDMVRGSGVFTVRQTEADGAVTSWSIHISPAINQLREGYWRYAFSAGERVSDKESIVASQLSHGFTDSLTLMGGAVYGEPYAGIATGVALDAGLLGGVTLSSSFSRSQRSLDGGVDNGQKYDVIYGKRFEYMSLSINGAWYSGMFNQIDNQSSDNERLARDLNMSLSTTLWGVGFSINRSLGYYREGGVDSTTSLNSSYGLPPVMGIDTGSITLNLQETENLEGKRDSRLFLGWSRQIFGGSLTAYQVNSSGDGSQNTNLQFSRSNERLSYSVAAQQQVMPGSDQMSYDTSLTYQGNRTTLRGAVTEYDSGRTALYGISGGIVAYSGGVVTSNEPVSSSYLIIDSDQPGSLVHGNGYRYGNWFGDSVVPRGIPYQAHHIDIDTSTVPDGVDVIDNAKTVLMKNYTAAHVRFESKRLRRVLVDIESKTSIPFGIPVKSETGVVLGWIGEDGQAFLDDVEEGQRIFIKWPEGNCEVPLYFNQEATRYFDKVSISC